ncbi:unnamed protein product [Aspergillus oryzae RIB40]|uniref:DNA, SC005 n=1 Tax=Aspergillus oryzae (strain ATCC 42149 / RIB 40) TaxID=510516 RepID=Q2UR17_ASPOR|nr:unnamed protein product [Aspergillus oryzae RIB40]BAE55998.1 unnamed protein product [Aspergillus oryzae RIB40]
MDTLTTPLKPVKRTTSSAFDVTRKRTLKEAGLRTEEHTNMVGIYLDIDPWTNPQDPEDVILASRRELERRMTVAEARYANPRGKPPNHRIRVYWVFPSEAQTAEEVFKEAWIYNMAFEEILERGKVFGFPVLLDGCCVVDILRTENRGKMENVSVADVGHCSWEDFLSKITRGLMLGFRWVTGLLCAQTPSYSLDSCE